MDFDLLLSEKVSDASDSVPGRVLSALARKAGGERKLAFLNVLCTSLLGFVITYPIYLVGGILAALPTALFTAALVFSILLAILSVSVGRIRSVSSKLLVFAIVFSLPFGLLSLPLLKEISYVRYRMRPDFSGRNS
ncbi:hypothetical protein JW721_00735 [Candidatus Micrarchaeota archaeon]|nr:hypothetical protein [Candidatus Micrarchaeota archaeon]